MPGKRPWVPNLLPTCCSRGCAVHDHTPYTAHTCPETLSHSLLAWCRPNRALSSAHSFSRVYPHLRSFWPPTGRQLAHIHYCNGKILSSRHLCNAYTNIRGVGSRAEWFKQHNRHVHTKSMDCSRRRGVEIDIRHRIQVQLQYRVQQRRVVM